MRSSADQHSWTMTEVTKERTYQIHQTSGSGRDSPLHRAPSSAAASRGALKKINSKRMKAREEEQRYIRHLSSPFDDPYGMTNKKIPILDSCLCFREACQSYRQRPRRSMSKRRFRD